jgi:RNA methyltransferase, TrmH family
MCRKASGFKSRVPHYLFMLTSLQNPLVKQVRKLHNAKYRRQQALFLLEGTHLVQEAAAVGWPMEILCYTADWQAKAEELFSSLQPQVPRCERVSLEVMQALTTTVNPDGVVAVAVAKRSNTIALQTLGLVLETIQDPGNVGTILRTAAATAVDNVLLSPDSADIGSPKVLRASAGAWFRVTATRCEDILTQVQIYQRQGFQIVATAPLAELAYWSVDYTQPTLILVGNEGAGLSAPLAQIADRQVSIPLSAGVESLNAAIATAVILYEVKRQRSLREYV